jgi:uncharacterized protein (DUF1501 family)
MPGRRKFIQGLVAGGLVTAAPGLSFALSAGDARLVLVILRGALDGLAAVPPLGDPDYAAARGALAFSAAETAATPLDGFFHLHPALKQLHKFYQREELLVLHAVASPYRERSHFSGQDVLETGAPNAIALRDGWLNRALLELPQDASAQSRAIGLSSTVPLVLRGPAATTSWAPSQMPAAGADTLARIAMMYETDPPLAARLQEAQAADAMAGSQSNAVARGGAQQFSGLAASAGRFLRAEDGPRVAVLEVSGWDTHANQGTTAGPLANRLAQLDTGLASLASNLGSAWSSTAVVVVTEFGRTVAVNGSRGSDHGTATCALLLGGAVAGGRVLADWPGLSPADLFQGRDLRPTRDLRGLFKALLGESWPLSTAALDQRIFPASAGSLPMAQLLRS